MCFVLGVLILLVAVLDELAQVAMNRKPAYQAAEVPRCCAA